MKTSTLSKCGWSASELNIDVWLIRSYIKRNHQFLSSCSCIVAITQLSAGLKWAKAVLRLGSECNWWLSSTFEWMGKKPDMFLYSRVHTMTKPIESAFVPLYCLHLCNSSVIPRFLPSPSLLLCFTKHPSPQNTFFSFIGFIY